MVLKKGTFVAKLSAMLNDPMLGHLIKWTPDGKGIVVMHSEEFARQVLSSYFKHSNFSSFVRQLYLYGFTRVSLPNGTVEFTNSNFVRGREDLWGQISRGRHTRGSNEMPTVKLENHSMETLYSQLEELKEQNRMLMEDNVTLRQRLQGGSSYDMKMDMEEDDFEQAGSAFSYPVPLMTPPPEEAIFPTMPPLSYQNSFDQVPMGFPTAALPEYMDLVKTEFSYEAGQGFNPFEQRSAFDLNFEEFGF